MNFLIVFCFLLTFTESLIVSDPSSTDEGKDEVETRPNRSKPTSIKYVSIPTEKCADIDLDSENSEEEICKIYCKELKKGFFDGECLDGTCHCKFDITAIVTSSEEKTRDKDKSGKVKGHQGVKCENLIRVKGQTGSENHKGCGIHCRLLNSQNKDGRCVGGVCQCSKVKIVDKQVVKEYDEDEEDEEIDDKCRSDEDCESECSGPNRESRCTSGICRCRILPPQQDQSEIPGIDREVKKCEHRRKAVSNEICRSHCEDFSRDHREGRCVDGICQCGYAVFEITETKNQEEDNKTAADAKRKSRRRSKKKY